MVLKFVWSKTFYRLSIYLERLWFDRIRKILAKNHNSLYCFSANFLQSLGVVPPPWCHKPLKPHLKGIFFTCKRMYAHWFTDTRKSRQKSNWETKFFVKHTKQMAYLKRIDWCGINSCENCLCGTNFCGFCSNPQKIVRKICSKSAIRKH